MADPAIPHGRAPPVRDRRTTSVLSDSANRSSRISASKIKIAASNSWMGSLRKAAASRTDFIRAASASRLSVSEPIDAERAVYVLSSLAVPLFTAFVDMVSMRMGVKLHFCEDRSRSMASLNAAYGWAPTNFVPLIWDPLGSVMPKTNVGVPVA